MKDSGSRKKRIPFLIFFVFFSLFFIFIAQFLPSDLVTAAATSGPAIDFQEDSWNFGEISPDELPTHIFKFKNAGDEVLIIDGVKVTCQSCTDTQISTKSIVPGESAELKITVNSLSLMGRFTKRIYVESNDPVNPRVAITVSGFIKEKNEPATQVKPKPQPRPQNPFKVGMSYFSQAEYDKAIPEFEKSIELDPNHTDSYYYLGQCYLQMGIIEYNKKHILKAYSLYRKANKVAKQAIPLYKKNIEDNPNDLNSYLRLGYIYETKSMVPFVNEHDKALNYYLKALNLNTVSQDKNIRIYVYLNTRIGLINYKEKDYPQTIKYLEKAIEVNHYKDNVKVYYYLGMSYDKMDEKEKALNSFSQVIEIAPQSELAKEAEKEIKKINKD